MGEIRGKPPPPAETARNCASSFMALFWVLLQLKGFHSFRVKNYEAVTMDSHLNFRVATYDQVWVLVHN